MFGMWRRHRGQPVKPAAIADTSTGAPGKHRGEPPAEDERAPLTANLDRPTVRQWVSANSTPGRRYSVDWCRFRRNSTCYFSGVIDEEATPEAGYKVYVPMDRGYCWRSPWEVQQLCASSQPGPRAQSEPRYLDATVPWEAMGQREYPTEIRDNYAVPAGAGPGLGPGESPVALSPGMPVAARHAAGTRWPAPPEQTPVLEPARDRPRAFADLVQLRTGGYLAWNEFKHLRARLGGPTGPVPLGLADSHTSSKARLATLHELGVINDEELEYLRRRLRG